MTEYRFIEPLDVLYLRGNKLFGDPGDHGAALMPPWPSLGAGALRSRMLVDGDIDPTEFAAGRRPSGMLGECLGTPTVPGDFRISLFTLARRDGQVYFPLPADTVVVEGQARTLRPVASHPALQSSYPLPYWPTLCQSGQGKPESGLWLNLAGMNRWLAGETPERDQLTASRELWHYDPRLGIALESNARTAAEGQLYTTESVALARDTGFLVGVQGAEGLLPDDGLLRFGGDGRGARVTAGTAPALATDWTRIDRERRFRLLLITPGLFPGGWRLPGLGDDAIWSIGNSRVRLVAAAVSRAEVISGWDLAGTRSDSGKPGPKPAQRVAPVGSVYWFEDFDGDTDDLRKRVDSGIPCNDPTRRAEGFNNVLIAAWPRD